MSFISITLTNDASVVTPTGLTLIGTLPTTSSTLQSLTVPAPSITLVQPSPIATGETTVPAVCYDFCTSAALGVESIGFVPQLCDSDSAFQNFAGDCLSCLEANDEHGAANAPVEFVQVYQFCAAADPSLVLAVTVPVTTSIGGVPQTFTFSTLITLGSTLVTTQTSNSSSLVTSPSTPSPTISQSTVTSSEAPQPPQPTPLSTATIAGAAAGSVSGLALLVIAIFLLWRRRKQQKRLAAEAVQQPEKPQLHSDSVEPPKKYELHETVSNRAELPAPIPELYAYDLPREVEGSGYYHYNNTGFANAEIQDDNKEGGYERGDENTADLMYDRPPPHGQDLKNEQLSMHGQPDKPVGDVGHQHFQPGS